MAIDRCLKFTKKQLATAVQVWGEEKILRDMQNACCHVLEDVNHYLNDGQGNNLLIALAELQAQLWLVEAWMVRYQIDGQYDNSLESRLRDLHIELELDSREDE